MAKFETPIAPNGLLGLGLVLGLGLEKSRFIHLSSCLLLMRVTSYDIMTWAIMNIHIHKQVQYDLDILCHGSGVYKTCEPGKEFKKLDLLIASILGRVSKIIPHSFNF